MPIYVFRTTCSKQYRNEHLKENASEKLAKLQIHTYLMDDRLVYGLLGELDKPHQQDDPQLDDQHLICTIFWKRSPIAGMKIRDIHDCK